MKDNDETPGGTKRHTPITFGDSKGSPPKQQKKFVKESKELYTPPSGKYSNKVSSYSKYSVLIGNLCGNG